MFSIRDHIQSPLSQQLGFQSTLNVQRIKKQIFIYVICYFGYSARFSNWFLREKRQKQIEFGTQVRNSIFLQLGAQNP